MPEEAPPPGTSCVVIDCPRAATLYVRIAESSSLEDEPNSIAMCDEHAANWRDGDPN
ncbi:MAG TPA: hypothetical protein VFH54_08760 [Mycobacteriales bacterium]|nr:hypothetical protein [Mycobacteriales bacterium]